MTRQTYLPNTKKIISETLDDETIIINLVTGSYYSMNPAGTALWQAIEQGLHLDTSVPSTHAFLILLEEEHLIVPGEPTEDAEIFKAAGIPEVTKYEDMQEMLLADPIHDVDEIGWPKLKATE